LSARVVIPWLDGRIVAQRLTARPAEPLPFPSAVKVQPSGADMSILGNILGKIFKKRDTPTASPTAAPAPATTAAPAAPAAAQPVDVDGILDFMNEQRDQKLNWRTSIVDLMKLTGMESTLAERTELANELGYPGDTSDTAAMNMWLHEQVMARIRADGGQIRDLTD
jgi:hypothetical protein